MRSLTVFLLLLLWACQYQEKNPATATDPNLNKKDEKPEATPPSTSPQPGAGKPEVFLYMVNVDNLLVRNEPTKQSNQVVTRLKEGSLITGPGEASTTTEEATLRGRVWNEPYYRVTAPDQKSGWAYGGGILPVYAGSRSSMPDPGRLEDFTTLLRALPIKKIESGKRAWDFVRANFGSTEGPTADAVFIILQNFLRRMEFEGELYRITESVNWQEADYTAVYDETFNYSKYPATRSIAAAGFRLETSEGMIYPIPDLTQLDKFFSAKVTPAMRAYLTQSALEQRDMAQSDAAIAIPLEQIADRAVFWENFNQEYPNFILKDETVEHQRWYRFAMTNGSNNSAVGYGDEAIQEEFRKGWEYTIQKYPNTNVGRTVKKIHDLAAANNWKYGPAIQKFQEEQANQYTDNRK